MEVNPIRQKGQKRRKNKMMGPIRFRRGGGTITKYGGGIDGRRNEMGYPSAPGPNPRPKYPSAPGGDD